MSRKYSAFLLGVIRSEHMRCNMLPVVVVDSVVAGSVAAFIDMKNIEHV